MDDDTTTPESLADQAATAIRAALEATRQAGYLRGRVTANPEASAEALARQEAMTNTANHLTAEAWGLFYAAVSE